MTNSEKSDDANAIVLSFQNVLKRRKGTNKDGTNTQIQLIIQLANAIEEPVQNFGYSKQRFLSHKTMDCKDE